MCETLIIRQLAPGVLFDPGLKDFPVDGNFIQIVAP
jgi:hypothetical protein